MIKQYILEDPRRLPAIAFFILTLAIFIFNMVYALKMKKSQAQEIASKVLRDDD